MIRKAFGRNFNLEVFFNLKPIEDSTNPQANLVSANQPPFLSLGIRLGTRSMYMSTSTPAVAYLSANEAFDAARAVADADAQRVLQLH
ncbi:MAG: hypothetical protein F6K28_17910 [Microcoleus sp. SIO2G3]|nr:hypothetical protein [Microcoleus sp. SIO2G3]